MSRFTTAANGVRVVVLLVVLALALSWADHRARPPSSDQAVADAPVVAIQQVVRGTSLRALPVPAPTARSRAGRSRMRHGHDRSAHHRHGRSHQRRTHLHRAHAPRQAWTGGGQDISWPQCPTGRGRHRHAESMPRPGVRFVVVGLTAGRAFAPNPCLARHLRWVRAHHVYASAYAFAGFPSRHELRRHRHQGPHDGHSRLGALRNAGYATALYNVRLMRRHAFATPHVWLDVEPSTTHPWSHRRVLNRAVVQGWIQGYRSAGYSVGVYSTPLLWHHILGRYRPGLPEWRTAGPTSPRAARRACAGTSFQGGRAVIAQWWTRHRDFDRLCPTASSTTTWDTYFHRW